MLATNYRIVFTRSTTKVFFYFLFLFIYLFIYFLTLPTDHFPWLCLHFIQSTNLKNRLKC